MKGKKRLLYRMTAALSAALMCAGAVLPAAVQQLTAFAAEAEEAALTATAAAEAVEAPDPSHVKDYLEGTHSIMNVGTGLYMNYAWSIGNPNPIWISEEDGSDEQQFTIEYFGDGKYHFRINHSDGGYVNCECATADQLKAGIKITGRAGEYDDTQFFRIVPLETANSGPYLLQSAVDKNLVIGATSTQKNTQLTLQTYTGSDLQKWQFSPELFYQLTEYVPEPVNEKNIPEGTYNLVNSCTDYCMNYAWSISNPGPIWAAAADGSVEQTFNLEYVRDGKYHIRINHEDGGYVNCECATAEEIRAGIKITGRAGEDDDTQYFWITPVADGEYILQSAANPEMVVAAPKESDRTQLVLEEYNGNPLQCWKLQKTADVVHTDPVESGVFDKGIDVSVFQGSINWNQVAADGVKFAVIRSATTNISDATYMTDKNFATNYAGAKAAGLKLGTYIYTSANTKAEMKSNIDDLLNTLGGRDFDMPVYLDIEQATRQSNLGKAALTEVISYGCGLIRAAGYQSGVYANKNWFTSYIDAAKLKAEGVEIWMAAWPYSDRSADPADFDYSGSCKVWQYSSVGSVSGISGNVDLDVRYGKFEEITEPEPVTGDVNADGVCDTKDIVMVQKYLLTTGSLTEEQGAAADLDGNGLLTAVDLTLLKQILTNPS